MHARSCWERLGRRRLIVLNSHSVATLPAKPVPIRPARGGTRRCGAAAGGRRVRGAGPARLLRDGARRMPDVACTPVRDVRPHGLTLSDRHDARPGVAPPGIEPGTGATALRERQSRSHTSQSAIISRKARVHASNGETDSQRPAVCAHNTYLNQPWIHVPDSTPRSARQCNDECN